MVLHFASAELVTGKGIHAVLVLWRRLRERRQLSLWEILELFGAGTDPCQGRTNRVLTLALVFSLLEPQPRLVEMRRPLLEPRSPTAIRKK